jgi:hypothetical protein
MKFKGRTEDAAAPFLGADFWKPGVKILGKVTRCFDSENGPCTVIRLAKPLHIGNDEYQDVAIGGLKGFQMALQAGGLNGLRTGDTLYAECTGFSETTKGHSRANFEIEVERHPEGGGAHA